MRAPMIGRAGPLDGTRVLVIDDHEEGRALAATAVADAGAHVVESSSLEHATSVLSADAFTVIIFGVDPVAGVRVLDASDGPTGHCALIAVTGRKEAHRNLRRLGFDAVMVKPVDPFDLVAVVTRYAWGVNRPDTRRRRWWAPRKLRTGHA
jgi:CheY-like chemotaxis protein